MSLFNPSFRKKNKINTIGFLGLGRIGPPQSLVFANKGFTIFGFDINPLVINDLNENQVPFNEPFMVTYLKSTLKRTFFPNLNRPTNQLLPDFFSNSQAIIICHKHKELLAAAENSKLYDLLSQVNENCYIFDGWSIWTEAKNIEKVHYEGLGNLTQVNQSLMDEIEDESPIIRAKL